MELSQAEMNERMEHGAEWAFKKLDTMQGERLELESRFRSALEQEQADREALDGLLQEVKELTAQSLEQGFESFLTIWEALTPEQREALLERWERKKT
jgi:Spy/CpxP family protein refolding chaperone